MSSYPGYPDNRIIVNGVDLTTNFGMVLLDGFTLNPPEPKTSYIDIPGGNGFIDLTDSLNGDVVYSQRQQEFTFVVMYPYDNWEVIKTRINNFLHGRSYEYKLTFDPDYTYKGRFTISSYEHAAYVDGIVGSIKLNVTAEPYKYKPKRYFKIVAPGGKWYSFESGRKPVRPVIETKMPCTVIWNRKVIKLGVGTFRLNDVLFTEGINSLYFNSLKLMTTMWNDVKEDGQHALTWNDAKSFTWDEIQRLYSDDITTSRSLVTTWIDMRSNSWQSYIDKRVKWADLNYNYEGFAGVTQEDFTIYMEYEWGDL